MAVADDDDRRRLPGLLYLIIGVLAVIGLFSISGFILGTIAWLIRAAVVVGLAAIGLMVLKAIFFGRSGRRAADSDL